MAVIKSLWETDLDSNHLITTIVNEICEHISEHFALILDDYHLVDKSEEINHFVNLFVQSVDENCHLIIASRNKLDLQDLPLMVGRSQIKGLDFEDLAFQAEEIQTLMQRNYHQSLSEEDVRFLCLQTEGWITALLLSAESVRYGMADQVRVANVSGVGLYDYLAQQVLEQQPSNIQDFLLKTSLLDEFNAELCAELFGDAPEGQSWSELITVVVQNNLFVQTVDDGGTWLRYHHLFRDFLQELLEDEQPDIAQDILLRLINVYCLQQEWEKAYAICQRLDDEDVTLDFITRAGLPLLRNGRYSILAKWIDALLSENLVVSPVLQALRGATALHLGEVEKGLNMLNQAEVYLQNNHDFLPRLHIWRAFACCKQGKYKDALSDADKALTYTSNLEVQHSTHAKALEVKGESLYFLGRRDEAVHHVEQALAIFNEMNDHDFSAYAHMVLGYLKMSSGQYNTAINQFSHAFDSASITNNVFTKAALYINLGVASLGIGTDTLIQANTYFNNALTLATQIGYRPVEAYAYTNIGVVYAKLSLLNSAIELFDRARIIAQETEQRALMLILDLKITWVSRICFEIDHAMRSLKSAESLISQNEASEILGWVALEKGSLYFAKGEVSRAIKSLDEAVNILDTIGLSPDVGEAHLYLACAYHASGDETKTAHHLNEASKYAAKLDSLHPLITAGRDAKDILVAAKKSPEFGDFATCLIETIEQFDKDLPRLRRLIRQQCEQVDMSKPELTILALGNARVRTYSEEVTKTEWTNQKAVRELFFLLLAYPDGLRKEAIGDELWPNSAPHQHYKQLNNTIYRLRRALGKNVVVFDTQSSCYHFNWGMDYYYDVEAFQDLVKQAQLEKNSSQKIALYKQVIDLYRGTYLPDVDGMWTVPLREFLRRTYTNVVLRVAELHFKDGKYEKVLGYCQQILNDDLCQEAAHRLAMRAYAARGDRVEIARQFDICRQSLLQLDTEPSAKTQRLFEQLMR